MQGRADDSQDAFELAAVAREDDEVPAREVAFESLVRGAVGDDLLWRRGVVHIPRITVLTVIVWRKSQKTTEWKITSEIHARYMQVCSGLGRVRGEEAIHGEGERRAE